MDAMAESRCRELNDGQAQTHARGRWIFLVEGGENMLTCVFRYSDSLVDHADRKEITLAATTDDDALPRAVFDRVADQIVENGGQHRTVAANPCRTGHHT